MADTNQLINNFYKVAQDKDFARDILFRIVNISAGDGFSIDFSEDDYQYIQGAVLPSRQITNVPVKYMGLSFNIPGTVTYPGSDSYTLTFWCDMNSTLRTKFEDYSRDVFDDSTSTGNYLTPKQSAVMDLVQFDSQFKKVAHYQLVGVSIRKIGDMKFSVSEGEGKVMSFDVTFSYHYYKKVD